MESNKAVEKAVALLIVVVLDSVVLGAKLLSLYALGCEFLVGGVIEFACLLFFLFGNFKPSYRILIFYRMPSPALSTEISL